MKERGNKVVDFKDGTEIHIGEDIVLQIFLMKHGTTKTKRLSIQAPVTTKIVVFKTGSEPEPK